MYGNTICYPTIDATQPYLYLFCFTHFSESRSSDSALAGEILLKFVIV